MGISNFDITVSIERPNGNTDGFKPTPGIPNVGDMLRTWARQTNSFSGSGLPRGNQLSPQQVQNATQGYVISIPMIFPQEEGPPEGEKKQPPAAGGGTAPTEETLKEEAVFKKAAGSEAVQKQEAILHKEANAPELVQQKQLLQQEANAPEVKEALAKGQEAAKSPEVAQEHAALQAEASSPRVQQQLAAASTASKSNPNPPGAATTSGKGEQGGGGQVAPQQSARLGNISLDYPLTPGTIWFAAVAHGGLYELSFWEGYHDNGGYPNGGMNFSYDECLNGCGTGVALAMDCQAAFFANPYGSTSNYDGPGTYSVTSMNGILNLDLKKNNQKVISGTPDTYEPPRDGLGPAVFPSEQAIMCVAVISSLPSVGPNITIPPNWMIIDQFVNNTVLGTLCIGKVDKGISQINFLLSGPGSASVALIACPQVVYSVPYQNLRSQGQVSTPFVPKSVTLKITPTIPGPYPPTTVEQEVAIVAPLITLKH